MFVAGVIPGSGQNAVRSSVRGDVREIKLISPSLKGNLLGDPYEKTIAVYLPPGYKTSIKKSYDGNSRTWTTDGEYSFNVARIMDALIAKGKIREFIIVAPSADNAYHGSFYANSPVTGNWEDYIFRDVVTYIDSNFRTSARTSSRGIAGHSMGGYGAIAIGMKHTDVFSSIYAHAPCCLALSDAEDAGKDPSPLWKLLGSYTSRQQLTANFASDEDLYANIFVAMSAALSPNPQRRPFYADFPFEEINGKLQLNKQAYEQWKAKTPAYLIDTYARDLSALRGFAFEFGTKEVFPDIRLNTPRFARALAERGIPHRFEIYPGGTHESMLKERLEKYILPFFSDVLDFSNP
jgi:S-formylglutathione hydrolase FrmB